MKKVTVKILTENDAFQDGNAEMEVARILREAAGKIESGKEEFTLFDINGHSVGIVKII